MFDGAGRIFSAYPFSKHRGNTGAARLGFLAGQRDFLVRNAQCQFRHIQCSLRIIVTNKIRAKSFFVKLKSKSEIDYLKLPA